MIATPSGYSRSSIHLDVEIAADEWEGEELLEAIQVNVSKTPTTDFTSIAFVSKIEPDAWFGRLNVPSFIGLAAVDRAT